MYIFTKEEDTEQSRDPTTITGTDDLKVKEGKRVAFRDI